MKHNIRVKIKIYEYNIYASHGSIIIFNFIFWMYTVIIIKCVKLSVYDTVYNIIYIILEWCWRSHLLTGSHGLTVV